MLVVACPRGVRGPGRPSSWRTRPRASATGTRPFATTSRPSRPTPIRPSTRSRSSAPGWRASRAHLDEGRRARGEGRPRGRHRASTGAPPSTTRPTAGRPPRSSSLEQVLRDRIEAARPKPQIEQMKERVRQAASESMLNPTSRDPLDMKFAAGLPVKQILKFLGPVSGINILFEANVQRADGHQQVRDRSRRRDARAGPPAGHDRPTACSTRC